MASRAITIANDVKNAIVAASLSHGLMASAEESPREWSTNATVVRAYLAQYDMQDLDYLRCAVMPVEFESVTLARKLRQETYGVDVVLQGRYSDTAETDRWMEFAEEINELLEHQTLATSGAVWIGVTRTPLFDTENFNEANMFATSSRNQFRAIRSVT